MSHLYIFDAPTKEFELIGRVNYLRGNSVRDCLEQLFKIKMDKKEKIINFVTGYINESKDE